MVTHAFNAMGPLHHRAPGLVGLALVDRRLTVGLIADGHHVTPPVLELVRRSAADRVALVSDASPAAGLGGPPPAQVGGDVPPERVGSDVPPEQVGADAPPERSGHAPLRLTGVEVQREADGAIRTAAGALAGSALTLDVAVRRWTELTEASLAEAVRAASEVPAGAVGIASGLRPGAPADLIVLDEGGELQRVMRRGRWQH
jgi:N-acetylglucosamine-6-phosphate deacetylase